MPVKAEDLVDLKDSGVWEHDITIFTGESNPANSPKFQTVHCSEKKP